MNQLYDKARILSEALPYIREYQGKTIVIKYGGGAMKPSDDSDAPEKLIQTEDLCRSVISDVVLLTLVGIRVVLVHGGGSEISQMLERIGKEAVFVKGLRYTDAETMEIAQMVLCGKVGKQLVQLIGEEGGKALGLSGLDGRILVAKQLNPKLGFVGKLTEINPEPINLALAGGYIPVVSTIACGEEEGTTYNINADTAAAKLAAALEAEKLILMTDVRGLMRDLSDENSLITQATLPEVAALFREGVIRRGMRPKIECCVEAIREGVKRAHILDGRIPHSVLIEVFSDEGIGTMLTR